MFRSIVHANDGTENAFGAFRAAIDLAVLSRATLEVVFVEECEPRSGTIEEVREQKEHADREVRERHAIIRRIADRSGIEVKTHVFIGHPVHSILAFARERQCDLLVIGATVHRTWGEVLWGSPSTRLVRDAQCSVLVVRDGHHKILHQPKRSDSVEIGHRPNEGNGASL